MGAPAADPLASVEAIDAAVSARVAGLPWVIAMEHAAMLGPLVDWLRERGAADVLVVASTRGVGDLPDAEIVYTGIEPQPTLMAGIRAHAAALADPSLDLVAAVDRFDPDGSARVITAPFDPSTRVVGRAVDGARRPDWVALEDKTTVDALWAAAGIPAAPSVVVPVADAPAAASDLTGPLGTVWAADNTEGWHGGAEYTRWVPNPADVDEAVRWFATRARAVRVMPFLDGIPCSIHGFVTRSGTAAFRPWEMVIFRRANPPGFVYAGGASFWDPPGDVRDAMRTAARAVGERLRETVDYRGPFSIDGVLTADGFLPTELNPRPSAGFLAQSRSLDLPIGAMVRAVIDGAFDVDAAWLEDTVLAGADADRVCRVNLPVAGIDIGNQEPVELSFENGSATEAAEPDGTDGTLSAGPMASGTLVRLDLDATRTPAGPSVAPLVAAAATFARDRWGLPIPDLSPAPDLRP